MHTYSMIAMLFLTHNEKFQSPDEVKGQAGTNVMRWPILLPKNCLISSKLFAMAFVLCTIDNTFKSNI